MGYFLREPQRESLKIKARNKQGFRILPPGKWFINRNTPVGEPADFYEVKPYGGKRLIPITDIIEKFVEEISSDRVV